MVSYPHGKFIQEFAIRTLSNLEKIGERRAPPYEDTALIGSLLAVFVLPHEREAGGKFMAEILSDYGNNQLKKVVEVLRPKGSETEPDDFPNEIPKSLAEVPTFMRHAVAHLNIKPESEDGQDLTHLLVWNRKNGRGPINFVARVNIRELRTLALHVLQRLGERQSADKYEGIDPLAEYDKHHATPGSN
jgi:hypothetical protein